MSPSPSVVVPPKAGLWRVGRSPDPLRFSDPLDPDLLDCPSAGNRFDSPTKDYRVCYFASTLGGCFGETLSRFRPNPRLAAVAQEEGFMSTGGVPADWRHRRLAIRVTPMPSSRLPTIRFLDVEAAETRAVLRDGSAICSPSTDTPTWTSLRYAEATAASPAGSAGGHTTSATRRIGRYSLESATSRDSPLSGSVGPSSRTWRSQSRSYGQSCTMTRRSHASPVFTA